eukprot:7388953-Prymnesium_polylepis.2
MNRGRRGQPYIYRVSGGSAPLPAPAPRAPSPSLLAGRRSPSAPARLLLLVLLRPRGGIAPRRRAGTMPGER